MALVCILYLYWYSPGKGHVSGVLPITTAKVPILKVVDRGTGVECDISVENRDGILKSQIIHLISSIDERFKKLSFLTRKPPILSPFSAIFKDGADPVTVKKSLSNFVTYGKSNKESLAELFVTLLIKLSSIQNLWPKGLCVSTYEGSWTSKTWNSKVACISVEDFRDLSQNVARAVGQAEIKQIYECINLSTRYVLSFMDGQIGEVQLKEFLFGHDGITTLCQTGSWRQVERAMPFETGWTKKIQSTEGWREMPDDVWEGKKYAMPSNPRNGQQLMRGWGGTQHSDVGLQSGVHAKGWGGTREPVLRGWGGVYAKVWERTREPVVEGRDLVDVEGWGRTRQPIAGDWDWVHAENWKGTQQPVAGGWVEVCAEGWGQNSATGHRKLGVGV
ncbi:Hypothetical predicted protein [Olea europaea subsp. europaea]|uniref:Poly(A) RNA polymerase mitochondrial-like central palm domain-containing protein n=1 Tax=Olea europaea subsp. europaea TaxID=158383 RepID=A0A8S0QHR6_OLEEU|nr:Hypothetical predicted protein [Olea europaea subsp. europaea]